MMSFLMKACRNDLTMNLLQASLKREHDRMELRRAGRSLRRRMSGLEKQSDESRREFTERINFASGRITVLEAQLARVERALLEDLRRRVCALESNKEEKSPVQGDEKERLLARIDELQALVASGTAELDRANAALRELEDAYSHLKAAVAAATSIEDLGWVPL